MSETHCVACCKETWVSLGLFSEVVNASWLRGEATGGRLEAALLDPSMLVSSFHVLAAVNKALVSRDHDQMKTRSVYSEIIFNLSPSTNMKSSFKTFGIKDESRCMLGVVIHQRGAEKFSLLQAKVQGVLVPLSDLPLVHHREEIIQYYKVPSEELSISSLENSVVTRLAIKDST